MLYRVQKLRQALDYSGHWVPKKHVSESLTNMYIVRVARPCAELLSQKWNVSSKVLDTIVIRYKATDAIRP